MDGWRGLAVLTIGLAIGVGLWLGAAGLVHSGQSGSAAIAAAVPAAQGVTGASAAQDEADASKPFAIEAQASQLQDLLEKAPYIRSGAPGRTLYVVTFRSCPACAEFKAEEWAGLKAAGVDLRWIVYARRDLGGKARSLAPERALVAELALSRSYDLLDRWFEAPSAEAFYASPDLPPAPESSPERMAALEAVRALVDSLAKITAANGTQMGIPAFFWQEDGRWHAMIGYEKSNFAAVRQALVRPVAVVTPPAAGRAPEAH